MVVTVQMFGAFRALGDRLELNLPDGAKVLDLRAAMRDKVLGLELEDLLSLSKFADEKSVLADGDFCETGQILAILPPVSGG